MLAVVLSLTIALAALAAPARAGDDLPTAKELYASAAYEDALAMLTRLESSGTSKEVAPQLLEYRSLCQFALGRTAEAEETARALLREQPMLDIDSGELPPRVQKMFAEVREQVLPGAIKDRYRSAKAAVDAKEFAVAESRLTDVEALVAFAARVGINDESLADIRILADGFRDLVRASASAQAAAKPAAPPPAAAPAPAPAAAKLFGVGDTGVAPPVTIRQPMPEVPRGLAPVLQGKRGIVQVTIEADGHVSDAVIRESMNKVYDAMLVDVARTWRYKPATREGTPVRFVKMIAFDLPNQ